MKRASHFARLLSLPPSGFSNVRTPRSPFHGVAPIVQFEGADLSRSQPVSPGSDSRATLDLPTPALSKPLSAPIDHPQAAIKQVQPAPVPARGSLAIDPPAVPGKAARKTFDGTLDKQPSSVRSNKVNPTAVPAAPLNGESLTVGQRRRGVRQETIPGIAQEVLPAKTEPRAATPVAGQTIAAPISTLEASARSPLPVQPRFGVVQKIVPGAAPAVLSVKTDSKNITSVDRVPMGSSAPVADTSAVKIVSPDTVRPSAGPISPQVGPAEATEQTGARIEIGRIDVRLTSPPTPTRRQRSAVSSGRLTRVAPIFGIRQG